MSRLRRLAAGLDRVARIGQDRQRLAAEQELARVAGDLLLALAEGEPGEIAHVLAPDPEVGVDAGLREARPDALEAGRTRRPIGVVPALDVGCRRRRREVRRDRQSARAAARAHGLRYFLTFAWCSLSVLANAEVPVPSPLAMKYR